MFSAVSGKPLPKWEHHPDRITEVRLFAIEQAARFGLPEEQALRLADALVEERASGAGVDKPCGGTRTSWRTHPTAEPICVSFRYELSFRAAHCFRHM